MIRPVRSILLALTAINLAGVVAFAVLRFGYAPQIERDAFLKYAELDRAALAPGAAGAQPDEAPEPEQPWFLTDPQLRNRLR